MILKCNKCKKDFSVYQNDVRRAESENRVAVYYVCPHCEEKYLAFTIDERMSDLIQNRIKTERKIMLARQHKFREGTIKNLFKEYDRIKAEQKKLADELKPIGEEILRNLGKEDSNGEEHPSDES